jgi:hypothetical protein
MRIDRNKKSVIMEVEFFVNGDNSIGLLGKDGGESHGLAVQVVGVPGTLNSHPSLYKCLATILGEQGLR